MTKTASPKQFSFIGNLIEDRKVQLNIEHVTMAVEAIQHQRLTSVGASEMIDTLLGMANADSHQPDGAVDEVTASSIHAAPER